MTGEDLSQILRAVDQSYADGPPHARAEARTRFLRLRTIGSMSRPVPHTCSDDRAGIRTEAAAPLPGADSEHDTRERSAAEFDAPTACPMHGCCEHENSSRAAGCHMGGNATHRDSRPDRGRIPDQRPALQRRAGHRATASGLLTATRQPATSGTAVPARRCRPLVMDAHARSSRDCGPWPSPSDPPCHHDGGRLCVTCPGSNAHRAPAMRTGGRARCSWKV